MKPIVDNGTNAIFGKQGYDQLPAQRYVEKDVMGNGETPCIQTVWELTDDELAYLQETKKIYVSMVGDRPQPIALDVMPFVQE